jgi:sarcosine oxidase subunit beta
VRAQGGTPATVALGRWSLDFYRAQAERYGIDSGFREHGYTILAVTEADEGTTRDRIAMQRANGLDVRWVGSAEAAELTPILGGSGFRGGSYVATDGCIDPPRNVLAYTVAMRGLGVDVRERTAFLGVRPAPGGGLRISTSRGELVAERLLLAGGPSLPDIGSRAGTRIPSGGTRHTVCVTEPHPAFQVERMAMVFDIGAGLYFRLEDGGLLFGYSNPDEPPGIARDIDWAFHARMRDRLAELAPMTRELALRKIWAATIEFTPDHFPIVGPALDAGGVPIPGVSVATAGGHGMMWGPALAKVAVDLALAGRTDVVDVTDLGLDRFDAEGRSRLTPDPIALPFPPSS